MWLFATVVLGLLAMLTVAKPRATIVSVVSIILAVYGYISYENYVLNARFLEAEKKKMSIWKKESAEHLAWVKKMTPRIVAVLDGLHMPHEDKYGFDVDKYLGIENTKPKFDKTIYIYNKEDQRKKDPITNEYYTADTRIIVGAIALTTMPDRSLYAPKPSSPCTYRFEKPAKNMTDNEKRIYVFLRDTAKCIAVSKGLYWNHIIDPIK